MLTPLAVDPAHPFPYISGLSLNLAVVVRNPSTGTELFARVKVPPMPAALRRRWARQRFVPLEDVIAAHLDDLFPGMEILAAPHLPGHPQRGPRGRGGRRREPAAGPRAELLRRRFGPPVRLEVEESIDPHVLDLLDQRARHRPSRRSSACPGPLDLTGLCDRRRLDRARPQVPAVRARAPAATLAEVETADAAGRPRARCASATCSCTTRTTRSRRASSASSSRPPPTRNVLAIKQTLYRTSGDSPIVDALIDAAEAGKQVLALVEIKARFDEQANIKLGAQARAGRRATSSTASSGSRRTASSRMVVREDGDRLRRYCHIGTGNYHPKTARLYEDFGLLTADPAVGEDVTDLFNVLSGYSIADTKYDRLLVAPHSVRTGLLERIEREVEQPPGGPARAASGSSATPSSTRRSSTRSTAPRRPACRSTSGCAASARSGPACRASARTSGCAASSGRFLEHSRVFAFANGGEPRGLDRQSADLMHRNLDRRVEALVRLDDPEHVAEIDDLFDLAFDEGTSFVVARRGRARGPGVDRRRRCPARRPPGAPSSRRSTSVPAVPTGRACQQQPR